MLQKLLALEQHRSMDRYLCLPGPTFSQQPDYKELGRRNSLLSQFGSLSPEMSQSVHLHNGRAMIMSMGQGQITLSAIHVPGSIPGCPYMNSFIPHLTR